MVDGRSIHGRGIFEVVSHVRFEAVPFPKVLGLSLRFEGPTSESGLLPSLSRMSEFESKPSCESET